jgi:UPF0755 protein
MERVRVGKLIKFILSLLIGLIVFSLTALWAVNYLNSPPDLNEGEDQIFSIEEGATLNSISNDLAQFGMIRYPWPMILYSRLMGTETDFKVGVYRISYKKSLTEIHDYLVEGRQQLFKVTIPEGWTSRQIADYLESLEITDREEFLRAVVSTDLIEELDIPAKDFEGFLYPDTYLFQKNFPAEKVVKVMVENFFSKLLEIYPEYQNLDKNELLNKIILASIVEREYRDPDEAPLMAGVFYNRLSSPTPIPLGSCATIVYIIADVQNKPHPDVITYRDLKILSPYNTYINTGLPPGPISNPGGIALKASFYPEKSDYLYFLLKNPESGQHVFTTNLSEHNAAYNLYIKKN